jgi:hypothetical protein
VTKKCVARHFGRFFQKSNLVTLAVKNSLKVAFEAHPILNRAAVVRSWTSSPMTKVRTWSWVRKWWPCRARLRTSAANVNVLLFTILQTCWVGIVRVARLYTFILKITFLLFWKAFFVANYICLLTGQHEAARCGILFNVGSYLHPDNKCILEGLGVEHFGVPIFSYRL